MAQYDTQFPAWLNQTKRDDAAIGFQMGQNILSGLKFQEQKKENEFARQQYVAEAPLREAKLAQAIAQQKATEFEANNMAIQTGLMANARMGQSQALALEADVSSSEGGWLNQDLPARVAAMISEFPGLNQTPWHKRMLDSMETAKTAQREQQSILQQIEERNVGALAVQDARNEGMLNRGQTPTAAMKNVRAILDSRVQNGELVAGTPEFDAAQSTLMRQLTGSERRLNPTQFSKLEGGDVLIRRGDRWINEYKQFQQKFGADAIKKYLGPVDVPIQKVMDQLRERKDDEGRAALDLLSNFAGVFNTSAFATGGKTLTKNEIERKQLEIGTTVNQNLPHQFENWVGELKNEYSDSVNSFRAYNYEIPSTFNETSGVAAPAAPAASGGFKVIRKAVRTQ